MDNVETKSKELGTLIGELKSIIAETLKIDVANVDGDTKFFNGGLCLNSIQMIGLTISIEKYYKKEFEQHLLVEKNFENLGVLARVIKENF